MFSKPLFATSVRRAALALGVVLSIPLSAFASDLSSVKIVLGFNANQQIEEIKASGVLDDAPYKLEYARFDTVAQTIEALNAGSVDFVYSVGGVSLDFLQGNAREEWTTDNVPFKYVSLRRSAQPDIYPLVYTLVRADSGIETPADLRGKKFAYNKGGNNHSQFLLTLKAAGLEQKDVEPVLLSPTDGYAALLSGSVQAWAGSPGEGETLVRSGIAKVLVTDKAVGNPNTFGHVASKAVLADPLKSEALEDFFVRVVRFQAWAEKNVDKLAEVGVSLGLKRERADLRAAVTLGKLAVIGPDVYAADQNAADALFKSGDIARKIDVRLQYDERFNAAIARAQAEFYSN